MRIIKEPPKFEPIELACGHCHANLLAESPDEFIRTTGGGFGNEPWDYAVATCPCCQGTISVERSLFPDHIYQKLQRDTDR